MRMWMVDPTLLCNQHLLGEHVEIHMLIGALKRNKNIQGHLTRGQLAPHQSSTRHKELVREMANRGMNHKSPLEIPKGLDLPHGSVDINKSLEDLSKRCEQCRERQNNDTMYEYM